MPQINRIRVNNVKYNFGTQYYDDFMMRFSGKNTIYDLANGGGKSLLMLLLLQNVIPNCTLDEKQPIEKLFRGNTENTAIHSMIEWNLDNCYRKDNYKYMLTGFCARKARSQSASDMEGNDSNTDVVEQSGSDNARVEYFNYVIFYREFGENDIKNLPLEKGDKKITYQELKDYLRDLEKKDFNVSVKIFERKGDYQNFISQYGIFESEWEIVRGINKTEGHVRTYFENTYKTSRKVVEDLLIEEIIQKSYHNKLGVENDDNAMARTLLDIKDKLLELSVKNGQINQYDRQIETLEQFAKSLEDFKSIYANKEKYLLELVAMRKMATKTIVTLEDELAANKENVNRIDVELENEQKLIDSVEIFEQEKSFAMVKELVDASYEKKNELFAKSKELRDRLTSIECVYEYKEYKEYQNKVLEIDEIMNNRLRDHDDIVSELKELSKHIKMLNECLIVELEKSYSESKSYLESFEKELSTLTLKLEEDKKEEFKFRGKLEVLTKEISELEAELAKQISNGSILIVENAKEEAETKKIELTALKSRESDLVAECEKLEARQKEFSEKIAKAEATIEIFLENIKELVNAEENANSAAEELDNLKNIYMCEELDKLADTIQNSYDGINTEIVATTKRINDLESYINGVKKGVYTCDGEEYAKVYEYLISQYGEDVLTGSEWYASLNQGQKRDIYKRVPFIHYGFVIKNDFERIKADEKVGAFLGSSYAVPVISENVLIDSKLEVNNELIKFASRDLSFLTDMGKVQDELRKCTDEISELENKLSKLNDRKDVIGEDLVLVKKELIKAQSEDSYENKRKALDNKYKDVKDQKDLLVEGAQKTELKHNALKEELKQVKEDIDRLLKDTKALDEILALNQKMNEFTELKNEYSNKVNELENTTKQSAMDIEPLTIKVETFKTKASKALESIDAIKKENVMLDSYADANQTVKAEISGLKKDEAFSKFNALKAIIENDTKDIEDKKQLKNHLLASMDKCKDAIEYKGLSIETVEKMIEDGKISFANINERKLVKEELSSFDSKIEDVNKQLESQSALYNRLDGSIAHGIHQIEEKYGSYEPIKCENSEHFMSKHKALIVRLKDSRKKALETATTKTKKQGELELIIRDIDRLVRASLINVDYDSFNTDGIVVDFKRYDEVQNALEQSVNLERRRKDLFEKQKKELVLKLNELGAKELSMEFEQSLLAPKDTEGCDELASQIYETNDYICLEKDRIFKSIEDMQKIKDSFENRCIQTCSNIRTELSRLPKLSTITMEDEVISIIGLSIPYVKEESYKERMSAYIDETVTAAESFESSEERLKYIRNRLTWKRLFSVIVTDMNAIKVNLYKRERIKSQSRYLKYEEAVGSTGQSQGIYIQFLIAIINYISNINASANEAATLGKTIFIDNPFGAAKDIYIWEPIFKLLKTNHVQLIVPARGATPAITGRFEVNYILGQKLVDNRQQTVVIDYQSNVSNENLEYTRLDYEQQSLNLL